MKVTGNEIKKGDMNQLPKGNENLVIVLLFLGQSAVY